MTMRTGHIGYLIVIWELHFVGYGYFGSVTHITGSKFNLRGLGFRGFREITETESVPGGRSLTKAWRAFSD